MTPGFRPPSATCTTRLRPHTADFDVGFIPASACEAREVYGPLTAAGAAADAVNAARARGGRVVVVGTTGVRTLESVAEDDGRVRPGSGWTELFITPGFRFRVTDALITNFHLPRTTLLMLVSAFAGRERVLAAYETAVRAGYRFYSFGDAMLIA